MIKALIGDRKVEPQTKLTLRDNISRLAFIANNQLLAGLYKNAQKIDPASASNCFIKGSPLSETYARYVRDPKGYIRRYYDLSGLDNAKRDEIFLDIQQSTQNWKNSEELKKIIMDGKVPNDKQYENCFPEETTLGKQYAYYTINDKGVVERRYDLPEPEKEYIMKDGRLMDKAQQNPPPMASGPAGIAHTRGDLLKLMGSSNSYGLIRHPQSGKCLDANGAGTSVYFGTCNEGNQYQQWQLNGKTIQHRASNKCLDVTGNGVSLSACPTWDRDDRNDLFRHERTNKCLDGDGSKVYLGPCGKDNSFQKWKPMIKSTFGNKDDLIQYLNYDESVQHAAIRSSLTNKEKKDNSGTDWAYLGRASTYGLGAVTKPMHDKKLSTYGVGASSKILSDNTRNKGVKPADKSKQKKQSFMNFMPQE